MSTKLTSRSRILLPLPRISAPTLVLRMRWSTGPWIYSWTWPLLFQQALALPRIRNTARLKSPFRFLLLQTPMLDNAQIPLPNCRQFLSSEGGCLLFFCNLKSSRYSKDTEAKIYICKGAKRSQMRCLKLHYQAPPQAPPAE